jgi:hypothetical protein
MTIEALAEDGFGELGAAVERANTEWLRIARPIIKAMFGVEDALYVVSKERLADPLGYVSYAKMSPASRAWKEAQDAVNGASNYLQGMLDGIRDNALCDHRRSCLDGMSEAEGDAVDEWNDRLDAGVVSVDAAVKMIGEE